MHTAKMVLISVLSALLVLGCSNDDSSTESTVTESTVTEAIVGTVAGVAAKGIIQQGIVKAYALSSFGEVGVKSVGNAVTGVDGSYLLSISGDYDGTSPLLLELTADSKTEMLCNALTGCGSVVRGGLLKLPALFKLTSIIPAVGADVAVNAQITAFTHIAAKNIQASGDLSRENITTVTSKVNQLVGVNILETIPVNITDINVFSDSSVNEQRYAILLAALAELAYKDENGDLAVDNVDMLANLENFANDFVTDDNFGSSGGLVLKDLFTAVDAEITNLSIDLDPSVITLLKQHSTIITSQSNASAEYQPSAATGSGLSDIERAKSLVAEVQSWNTSLSALESPAELFLDEAETIVDTLDQNSRAVIEIFAKILTTAADEIKYAIEHNVTMPINTDFYNADQLLGGILITDTSNNNLQEFSVIATNLEGVSVTSTLKLNSVSDDLAPSDSVFEVRGNAANMHTKITLENTVMSLGNSTDINALAVLFKGALKSEKLNSGVATGRSATGDIVINMSGLPNELTLESDDLNFSLEKIELTDVVVVSGSSDSNDRLSISLEIDNVDGFDAFGYLKNESAFLGYESVIALHEYVDMGDFDLSAIKSAFNLASVDDLSFYHMTGQTCVSGFSTANIYITNECQSGDVGGLKVLSSAHLNNKYPLADTLVMIHHIATLSYSNEILIHANIYVNDRQVATNFNLSDIYIKDAEAETNYLNASLNITGPIDLALSPEALLALTVDKAGLGNGSFVATLANNGKSMQLVSSSARGSESATSGSLFFTNSDGIDMKISKKSDASTSGFVTVNGREKSKIVEVEGVVTVDYNDGTYDLLN